MTWQEWLSTRPECVRKLAAEFPRGTRVDRYFVIGYTEDDMLIVSLIDPSLDYDGAVESKEYVCAKHVRKQQQ